MADLESIKVHITAIKACLGAYARYEDDEIGRKKYLSEKFENIPELETYCSFPLDKLIIHLRIQSKLLLTEGKDKT